MIHLTTAFKDHQEKTYTDGDDDEDLSPQPKRSKDDQSSAMFVDTLTAPQ